jgi:hypothetical protein
MWYNSKKSDDKYLTKFFLVIMPDKAADVPETPEKTDSAQIEKPDNQDKEVAPAEEAPTKENNKVSKNFAYFQILKFSNRKNNLSCGRRNWLCSIAIT